MSALPLKKLDSISGVTGKEKRRVFSHHKNHEYLLILEKLRFNTSCLSLNSVFFFFTSSSSSRELPTTFICPVYLSLPCNRASHAPLGSISLSSHPSSHLSLHRNFQHLSDFFPPSQCSLGNSTIRLLPLLRNSKLFLLCLSAFKI